MAERRMFAKTIIDSDAFLDMPLSTQALYFHLSMRADDDGFINSSKKIQRMLGCNDDDLKILLAKNFLIPFDDGVCVIKHWRIHNYIQKDRYKPTVYGEHADKLSLKDNNVYTLETKCIQTVSNSESQERIGKASLVQVKQHKQPTKVDLPDNVDPSIWNDYLSLRKAKKAVLTKTALNGIIRESEKAGISLNDVLTICCERGWVGFKAEWMHKGQSLSNNESAFAEAKRRLFGTTEKEVN